MTSGDVSTRLTDSILRVLFPSFGGTLGVTTGSNLRFFSIGAIVCSGLGFGTLGSVVKVLVAGGGHDRSGREGFTTKPSFFGCNVGKENCVFFANIIALGVASLFNSNRVFCIIWWFGY